jgi:(2Fe-2S) ferredoxin
MFLPVDNALLRWLEKVAQRWRHRQPDPVATPRIVFARPLGQLDELPAALARQLDHAQRHPEQWPDVTQTQPDHWQNDPKAWSKAPPLTRHVLFCMGPRCTALGAVGLWNHLSDRLLNHPELKKTTKALHTSCQYPCNLGPLMIVYPDGTWWGHLDEAAIDRIVDAQLQPGEEMQAHLVHRTGWESD